MQLKEAQKIAVDICYKLEPHCVKINIAGSIRRQKPEVKDIEIICAPRLVIATDLFNTPSAKYRTIDFRYAVNDLGKITKGDINSGRQIEIDLPQGIKLDLFIPQPQDYYRIYAIRTGSAEYANKVIAGTWLKQGWCGTSDGLRRQSDCVKRGDKWACMVKRPMTPIEWRSEEEFFKWLGIPYVDASKREVAENYATQNYLAR